MLFDLFPRKERTFALLKLFPAKHYVASYVKQGKEPIPALEHCSVQSHVCFTYQNKSTYIQPLFFLEWRIFGIDGIIIVGADSWQLAKDALTVKRDGVGEKQNCHESSAAPQCQRRHPSAHSWQCESPAENERLLVRWGKSIVAANHYL